MYTPAQAIEAIQARISGEWDNPELLKLGALFTDTLEDIKRIVAKTEMQPVTSVLFVNELSPECVLAVFPGQVQKDGLIACYSSEGQHSTSQKGYIKMLNRAEANEYKSLSIELAQQGYNLQILNGTGYKL